MAITQQSSVNWDQTAYELLAHYALRAGTFYDQFATLHPTDVSMNGASVVLDFIPDMVPTVTALTETADITPATLAVDTQVTATLLEYGNGAQVTGKLRGTSYLPVDPILANVVGWNMAESLDYLALTEVMNGTNIRYGGGVASRVTIAAGSIISAADVRFCVAKLRGGNAIPWDMNAMYAGTIHPDVSFDLRSTTGSASWRDAMPYTDAGVQRLFKGYIGTFESVSFMETPRTFGTYASNPAGLVGTNLGVGGIVDVFGTHIFGREFMAKVSSTVEPWGADPMMVVAPQTDFLKRFVGLGWKWLGAYKATRQACAYRIESSSSIANNAT
jgi:N4-gp56 family major capsid protein